MIWLHFVLAHHILKAEGWALFYRGDEIWVGESVPVGGGQQLSSCRTQQIGVRSGRGNPVLYAAVDLDMALLRQLPLSAQLLFVLARIDASESRGSESQAPA
jgi:hypothetical protein